MVQYGFNGLLRDASLIAPRQDQARTVAAGLRRGRTGGDREKALSNLAKFPPHGEFARITGEMWIVATDSRLFQAWQIVLGGLAVAEPYFADATTASAPEPLAVSALTLDTRTCERSRRKGRLRD